MNAVARTFLMLVLVIALLPSRGVSAQELPVDPDCDLAAAVYGAEEDVGVIDGAIYCILYPQGAMWNGDVVMFAHGYIDITQPVGIPWKTQLVIDEQNTLPGLILSLGYAFATTSYSRNGLAVQEGVRDIVELAKHIYTGDRKVGRIFLTGASEGGLVTALAVERYPRFFAGGLSTCGPIGSFRGQVQYWGDFRVAYDQAYPQSWLAQNTTPIFIPQVFLSNWASPDDPTAPTITNDILARLSADPQLALSLLLSTRVPFDPTRLEETVAESVLGLLYYNAFSTNDGRMTLVPGLAEEDLAPPSLVGNPYLNQAYTSMWYPDGITPDPAALRAMKAYETTGRLSRQLVVMHTTGDPIIPFSQSLLYARKVLGSGRLSKLALIPVARYGHCAFEPGEMVFAFNLMVYRSTRIPFSPAQIQSALPSQKDQQRFKELKEMDLDRQEWDLPETDPSQPVPWGR